MSACYIIVTTCTCISILFDFISICLNNADDITAFILVLSMTLVRIAVLYAWLSAKKDRFLQTTAMIASDALEISE